MSAQNDFGLFKKRLIGFTVCFFQIVFKAAHEIGQSDAQQIAQRPDFEDVQAAFPRFVFADHRLRNRHALSNVRLAQSSLDPKIAEQALQHL